MLRIGPVQSTSSVPFLGIDIIGAWCDIVNEGHRESGLREECLGWMDVVGMSSPVVSQR